MKIRRKIPHTSAVRELSDAYYRENRRQNHVFIAAAAMSVFLLYTAFSLAYGKIHSDCLIDLRGMGTAATVSLENASARQYEQMKRLPYIEAAGISKTAGTAAFGDIWTGDLIWVDPVAYEKMLKPAYTDIVGNYPEKEEEIMLSADSLSLMGIENPSPGMTLEMDVLPSGREDGEPVSVSFILSGYYTDYADDSVREEEGYVSRAFLDRLDIPVFPADKVMAVSDPSRERTDIETMLYSDLTMEYEAQQVFAENPMITQSIEGVFGSVPIAAGCGILVILCAFLLIFNVVSITMARSVQQYGLLTILGASGRQLCTVAFRQNLRNIIIGIFTGSACGLLFVKLFLPFILQRLFMKGLGRSDVSAFYPLLLCGAAILTFAVAFTASAAAVRRAVKMNPVESVRYTGVSAEYTSAIKKQSRTVGRFLLPSLAWRNLSRSRRRLFISLFSLLTGCVTALCAAVIMTGTDLTNKIEENPDFQFGILSGITRFPEDVPGKINDSTPVLSQTLLDSVFETDGIDRDTFSIASGSYAVIDFQTDAALLPRRKSLDAPETGIAFATLQIVSDSFVKELEKYVDSFGLSVDMETFRQGNGCILLHYNELSEELMRQAGDVTGMPVHFYSLDAYRLPEDDPSASAGSLSGYEKGSLSCSGYLDMTDQYFPKLHTTSFGSNINYFIMTEDAFRKLGFPEKYFDVSFDTKGEDDALIHQKLSRLIQHENKESGIMDTFYLSANYMLLMSEQNRISASNIILGGLSSVLLAIGILNYTNTLFAMSSVRKRDLAIMQSLGLTSVQLKKMLFLEGMEYWFILMASVSAVGSAVIWGLAKAIRTKLFYFRFSYPWETLCILALTLASVCVLSAWIIYRQNREFEGELKKGVG